MKEPNFKEQIPSDVESTGQNPNVDNPVSDDVNVFKGEVDEEAVDSLELADEEEVEEGYDPYNKAA